MAADHLMVQLKPGVELALARQWAEQRGLRFEQPLSSVPFGLVKLPSWKLAEFDRWLIGLAAAESPFETAEPDRLKFAAMAPSDDGFPRQWALRNDGQTGGVTDADIDAPEAWDVSTGSASVVVAVIDSGVDLDHPDLIRNRWVNTAEVIGDGLDNDGNGVVDDLDGWSFTDNSADVSDVEGHGTFCAGLIGAGMNNGGVVGVCPTVKLMAVRALFVDPDYGFVGGYDSDIAASVFYAVKSGVKIISASYGSNTTSSVEKAAMAEAYKRGVIFVAAAGNESTNNDSKASYPASYSYDNVIAVAASDASDQRATFSNYGASSVDIAAPGVGICSTLPHLSQGYGYESGTSMSTPMVAGAAALVMAAYPTLTWQQVKTALLHNVDVLSAWSGKVKSGGRLNVARALKVGASAYPEIQSTTVKDAKLLGANGNGDGVINAGETITLGMTIKNLGPMTATGVTTTLSVVSGAEAVTIDKGTYSWGNIGSRAVLNNLSKPCVLRIAAGTTLPSFALRFTHTDSLARTWSTEQTFAISSTQVLAGRVTYLTGGKSASGVTVSYTGPVSGAVKTASDGKYRVVLPAGAYHVSAALAGWTPSAPLDVSLPPDAAMANFTLGRPFISVTPTSISQALNEGEIRQQIVTVKNTGDVPLNVRLAATAFSSAGTPAYFDLPTYYQGVSMASAVELPPLPFNETFESGSLPGWTASKIGPYWFGKVAFPSNFGPVGTRCLYLKMTGPPDAPTGWQRALRPDVRPRYIGYWLRVGSNAIAGSTLSLGNATVDYDGFPSRDERIGVSIDDDGRWVVNYTTLSDVPRCVPGQWHRVELRNIDWTSHLLDFYVDHVLLQGRIEFHASNPITDIFLHSDGAESETWWDDILLSDQDEGWLAPGQPTLTVPPKGSQDVAFITDVRSLRPGTYKARMDLNSDDPVRPLVSVSATAVVKLRTNTAPAAQSITVSVQEDVGGVVTLPATDAEGDPILKAVVSLPAKGSLWIDENATATQVTTVPATVRGSQTLRYVPPVNENGSAFTSFTFSVSDWRATGTVGTVTINVSPVNDAPVAAEDMAAVIPGSAITVNALLNDEDIDHDTLKITAVTTPGRGTAQIVNGGGSIAYTPQTDFLNGIDTFDYTIRDPDGLTSTATVRIAMGDLPGDWPMENYDARRSNYFPGGTHGQTLSKRWQLTLLDDNVSTPVIGGDLVFVTHLLYGKGTVLEAIDIATGGRVWSRSDVASPVYWNGRVYVMASDGAATRSIIALDASSGAEAWRRSYTGRYSSSRLTGLVADGAGIHAMFADSNVKGILLDAASGADVHTQQIAHQWFFGDWWSSVAALPGLELYRSNGIIVAYEATSPTTKRWSYQARDEYGGWVANDRYVFAWDQYTSGNALPVDADAKRPSWTMGSVSGASIGPGSLFVINQGVVQLRSLASGNVLHTYTTPRSPVNVVATPDTVFAQADDYGAYDVWVFDVDGTTPRQTLPQAGKVALGHGSMVSSTRTTVQRYGLDRPGQATPVADAQTASGTEDTPLIITLTASDADGSVKAFAIKSLPTKGKLYQTDDGTTAATLIEALPARVRDASGRVIFVPAADESGAGYASFSFIASDGDLVSTAADVTINIAAVPDAPLTTDDVFHVRLGEPLLSFSLLNNDFDPDADALSLLSFTQPDKGTLTQQVDGYLRYDAPVNAVAGDSATFTYVVSDTTARTASGTVKLVFLSPNEMGWTQLGGSPQNTQAYRGSLHGPLTKRWTLTLPFYFSPSDFTQTVALGDKFIFSYSRYDQTLSMIAAIDASTGTWLWQRKLEARVLAATLAGGRHYMIRSSGSSSYVLACTDPATGEELWQHAISSALVSGSALVGTDNGIFGVFVKATAGTRLCRYDLTTGVETILMDDAGTSNTPVVSGHQLVMLRPDKLVCLNTATGEVSWEFVGTFLNDQDALMLDGDRVFAITAVQSSNGLLCLDLNTGTPVWSNTTSAQIYGLSLANNTIFGAAGGEIRMFSALTGRFIGRLNNPSGSSGSVISSPSALADELVIMASYYSSGLVVHDLRTKTSESLATGSAVSAMLDGKVLVRGSNALDCFGGSNQTTAPVAQDQTVNVNEASTAVIQLAATPVAGRSLKYAVRSLPDKGKLYQYANGARGALIELLPSPITDPSNRLWYEAPLDVLPGKTASSFIFTAHTTDASSTDATISLNIVPTPDAPITVADVLAIAAGSTTGDIRPEANDRDPDIEPVQLESFTQGSHGVVTQNADGSLHYARNAGDTATQDSFNYTIHDATARTVTGTVTVLIGSRVGRDWPTYAGSSQRVASVPGSYANTTALQIWSVSLPTTPDLPVIGNGKVFVSNYGTNPTVRALNLTTGGTVWQKTLTDASSVHSLGWNSGSLYAPLSTSSGSKLRAFDESNGATRWTQTVPTAPNSILSPAFDATGIWFMTGDVVSYNGKSAFYHFGYASGVKLASTAAEYASYGQIPAVSGDRLCTILDKQLRCYDTTTGAQRWALMLGSRQTQNTPPAISDGRVFATVDEQGVRKLVCADLESGTVLWRVAGPFIGKPDVGNDLVFVWNNSTSSTEARDVRSGELFRSYPNTYSGTNIVTSDVLINGYYGFTKVIDLRTGDLLQTLPGGNLAFADNILIISTVYTNTLVTAYRLDSTTNKIPVATDQTITIDQDTRAAITLGGTDGDNDALDFTLVSTPVVGSLYNSTDGITPTGNPLYAGQPLTGSAPRLLYVPPPFATGAALGEFSFIANDGKRNSLPGTIRIHVRAVNYPPEAQADHFELTTSSTTVIDVLRNDFDNEDERISITAFAPISGPAGASVALDSNGQLIFTAPSTPGKFSFAYTIADAMGNTSTASVDVRVSSYQHDGWWPMPGGGPERAGSTSARLGTSGWHEIWTLIDGSWARDPIIANGRVYFIANSSIPNIRALTLSSVSTAWTVSLGANATTVRPPAWANDGLFVASINGTNAGQMQRLADDTGARQWLASFTQSYPFGSAAPTVSPAMAVLRNANSWQRFDVATGAQRLMNTGGGTTGPVAISGDRIFIAGSGSLYCQSNTTGNFAWSIFGVANGTDDALRMPAVQGSRVCVVMGDSARTLSSPALVGSTELRCYRITDGAKHWSVAGKFSSTPAIEGAHVFINEDNTVQQRSLLDGSLEDTFSIAPQSSARLIGQPTITRDLILAHDGTNLWLINRDTHGIVMSLNCPNGYAVGENLIITVRSNGLMAGLIGNTPATIPIGSFGSPSTLAMGSFESAPSPPVMLLENQALVRSPASVSTFKVQSIERLPSGAIRLSWDGVQGTNYQIECSINLDTWLPASAVIAGESGPMHDEVLPAQGSERCFFRIKSWK